uniref:Putative monolaris n=1 Tax=Amblyomma parvum TaxID=251391 RepID=A0A023G142_AMBPA
MKMYSVLLIFLFCGLCTATSRSTKDPKCITDAPIITRRGCKSPSWQFSLTTRKCVQTCTKEGQFESKFSCDVRCRSVDVCNAPRAVSSCAGEVYPIFFYNPTTQKCHRDIGCTFSGNNFPTITECQDTCVRRRPSPTKPRKCYVAPSQGYHCWWRAGLRFYYNPHIHQCLSFWYLGCGGSANRFRSYERCMRHCARL